LQEVCAPALAGSAAALAALLLLYRRLLASRSPAEAWRRGRLLLASSVAAVLALGALFAPLSLDTVAAALPLVVVTQLLVAQFFDRRVVGEALYGLNGRLHRVALIESATPTAFAVAVGGRVYASTALQAALPPDEAAAVIAHEVGHREALRPVPAAAALAAVAVSVAQAAEAVAELAAGGCPLGAAAVAAAAAAGWVLYNWAWEHLADTFSAAETGWAAARALARITGAEPGPPPGALGLLAGILRSLRPRRSPGGAGLLVNPHPPAGLRLWLLARILEKTRE